MGIVGRSRHGRTTLLERLVPRFTEQGLRLSLIKHSHKDIEVDRPGKDSWRLHEAGCQVLLLGRTRWALMHELRGDPEPELPYLLSRLQHRVTWCWSETSGRRRLPQARSSAQPMVQHRSGLSGRGLRRWRVMGCCPIAHCLCWRWRTPPPKPPSSRWRVRPLRELRLLSPEQVDDVLHLARGGLRNTPARCMPMAA